MKLWVSTKMEHLRIFFQFKLLIIAFRGQSVCKKSKQIGESPSERNKPQKSPMIVCRGCSLIRKDEKKKSQGCSLSQNTRNGKILIAIYFLGEFRLTSQALCSLFFPLVPLWVCAHPLALQPRTFLTPSSSSSSSLRTSTPPFSLPFPRHTILYLPSFFPLTLLCAALLLSVRTLIFYPLPNPHLSPLRTKVVNLSSLLGLPQRKKKKPLTRMCCCFERTKALFIAMLYADLNCIF